MDQEPRGAGDRLPAALPAWATLGATTILTLSGMAGIVAGQRDGTVAVILAGLLFGAGRLGRALSER